MTTHDTQQQLQEVVNATASLDIGSDGDGRSSSPPLSSTTLTTAGSSAGTSVLGPVSQSNAEGGGFVPVHPHETEQNLLHQQQHIHGAPHLLNDDHSQAAAQFSGVHAGVQPQVYDSRGNPSRYPVAIKLLVSNNVAGSIIGRQGQTISELQSQSMTRIKLSQSGDYFPGSHDRVCLIQGEPNNIKVALRLLLHRMHMLHEQECQQQATWQMQKQASNPGEAPSPMRPFHFIVRLLVPSSSCGMIIGKAGSNIKYLEEASGVLSVRLSPKEHGNDAAASLAAAERAVTMSGTTLESCLQCAFMVFDGMLSHPDVSRYSNLTTTYVRKGQMEAPIPGEAAALHPHHLMPQSGAPPNTLLASPPQEHLLHPVDLAYTGTDSALIPPPSGKTSTGPRRVTSLPEIYGADGRQDVDGSSSPYQMISPHGFAEPSHFGMDPNLPDQGPTANMGHSTSFPDFSVFQAVEQHPQAVFQQQQLDSAGGNKRNFLVPVSPICLGPNAFQAQIAVPDSMIGSILGRAGRTLNELQVISGTRIWISQRGEYVPGTRNRIVTVRGPTAHSIWQAQMFINQRIVLPPTATNSPSNSPPHSSSIDEHASPANNI